RANNEAIRKAVVRDQAVSHLPDIWRTLTMSILNIDKKKALFE
ncbi:2873_t:CDS:1, partial [Funneliformis caledonium]